MAYALRPGLTFCKDDDRFIFLDIPHDRYFALTDRAAASFARLVDGRASADDEDQLRSLAGRLLVEEGGSPLRAAVPPPAPRDSLLSTPSAPAPARDLMAWMAFRRAIRQVRSQPLDRIISGIRRLKDAVSAQNPRDALITQQAASSFHRAGDAASLSDRCLPHSIAVTRWLLKRGVRATLVIGVTTNPFQAHSWAQVGDLLVNDHVDQVRDFVPILVL